jgi:hypothetical protein
MLRPEDGHGIERHHSELLEKLHSWSKDLLLGKEGRYSI